LDNQTKTTSFDLFAVTAPGLAPVAALELVQLGLLPPNRSGASGGQVEPGGVAFRGGIDEIYRANLHLRTASRVLARLGSFNAAAFSELRKKAGRLPWENFLQPGNPISLRATSHKSRLYHSGAVAERVLGAVSDRLGHPVHLENAGDDEDETGEPGLPPQLVVVRIERDLCTISIDTSGELLHRRGYRLQTAKAPLRETLAAGMILASGWRSPAPFLDPFCGSGTLAIEAALLAGGAAPGVMRQFAFSQWPGYDAPLWNRLLEEAKAARRVAQGPIQASDRDAGAVEAARANAERAGVLAEIDFSTRAVSSIEPPPGPGWVVTNPPYGVRVSTSKDLRNLYARFGAVLRQKCPDWHAAVLSSDRRLLEQTHLAFKNELTLVNGGVRVHLALGEVTPSQEET
jgi:putative N6-adenine-specific DNA methylase